MMKQSTSLGESRSLPRRKITAVCLLVLALLPGCKEKKPDTTALENAFQVATPKPAAGGSSKKEKVSMADSLIQDAVTAIKNNENAEGVVILQMVRSQGANLTPEQLTAVQNMIGEAQKPLIERAAHGDPAALAAMEQIRMGKRRH
jgi:hypothetical protein